MKQTGKRYGDTKTHLDLSARAREAYDEYSPLSIYEREVDDDEYRYDISGCIDAHDLTAEQVNEELESLLDDGEEIDEDAIYRVLPSAIDRWYGNATTEEIGGGILPGHEVKWFLREWDMSEHDALEDLEEITPMQFDAAVALMDDEIREEIHATGEYDNNPGGFLREYCKLHEAKYGEAFCF